MFLSCMWCFIKMDCKMRIHLYETTIDSFSSSIDVGSHNSPPSRPSVLAVTRSLLQLMRDPPIHPPLDPASLLVHHLVSTPFLGSASSLAHRLVSGSDTICNGPSPPLANVVLFGVFLSSFLSMILKHCLLGKDFHTRIKNVSFSFPTDVGSYIITSLYYLVFYLEVHMYLRFSSILSCLRN